MSENPAAYFRKYRESIGFSNQNNAKHFLAAKDISPGIDFNYIDALNDRIADIVAKINLVADDSFKRKDLSKFAQNNIYSPYSIIKKANLLPSLNNQGRRPESVLFSWLRGYAIAEYFTPSFSKIFCVPLKSITQIGDDDLRNIETFRRSPKADLEFTLNSKVVRVEVQSGFQGVNDIKEHKVREAKRVNEEKGINTICIHIDLFNGQVAFVQLDSIEEDDVNWITRTYLNEGVVFNIDQNYFVWNLVEKPPIYTNKLFD